MEMGRLVRAVRVKSDLEYILKLAWHELICSAEELSYCMLDVYMQ